MLTDPESDPLAAIRSEVRLHPANSCSEGFLRLLEVTTSS